MSYATLAAIFAFMFTYNATTGGAFWIYTGEICNEKQTGVVVMALMIGILFMALFTNSLMSSGLHICGTFWFFSACSFFAALILFLFMKETKGLTKSNKCPYGIPPQEKNHFKHQLLITLRAATDFLKV
eukprot:CAMPEP_0176380768 /NCGR_PEP_ID=MMETSP0126-20121128/31370_1 /TAXON_ID=141414 ORGANISM="Strombidinopsis acuminatum, Strain SPMC142" /NCGR_SAMPLE_ID=MMETSP0126 /ASSEMBLY_ACC=CAM_ASM_000229 /LENGTH=128 /DNA_ID=CAMNT_0017744239 /DNA_START=1111 /DNA_END=1498 /DNA_ORIENTATION=+